MGKFRLFTQPIPWRANRHDAIEGVSSHARKRESSLAVPQYNRWRVLRAPPLDSRFRAREEIGRRYYSSSFPRKRESRAAVRKTLRCFSCGSGRLDSRFRGNDEVLWAGYRLSLRRLFGVPAVIVRGVQFLHTLFRGNDEAFLADYCLSPRRIFSAPVVICKNFSISSHDRERDA